MVKRGYKERSTNYDNRDHSIRGLNVHTGRGPTVHTLVEVLLYTH